MKTILFVCTGNTCRSPMAAAIASTIFAKRGINAAAASCGVFAAVGAKASKNAVAAVKKGYSADISGHRAKMTDETDLAGAHMVITMTMGHKNHICYMYPDYAHKVHTLGELCGDNNDIEDPFGADLDTYRQCADQIGRCLENLNWGNIYDCFGM